METFIEQSKTCTATTSSQRGPSEILEKARNRSSTTIVAFDEARTTSLDGFKLVNILGSIGIPSRSSIFKVRTDKRSKDFGFSIRGTAVDITAKEI